MSKEVLILLDADVVIHLFKAGKVSLLNELYPDRLRILDIVLDELRKNPTVNSVVDNLFTFKQVSEITFPTTSNPQLFQEYISLKHKIKGAGERACLLYCKYHQHIIASSNTSDILPFCKEHSVAYLTTLDILSIAVKRKKLTIEEANDCIQKVITNGSFFLCHNIEQYIKIHFDTIKLNY